MVTAALPWKCAALFTGDFVCFNFTKSTSFSPRLSNLRTLNVRGFGPKNSLADAVAVLAALPSLRTLRLLITGEGDIRRETALLTMPQTSVYTRLVWFA